jgi:hypothetical protein
MRVGDEVRLLAIPPYVKDHGSFKTRTLLTKCLGRVLTAKGFQPEGGGVQKRLGPGCWIELHMSEIIRGCGDTIWVDPAYVERVPSKTKRPKKAT